MSRPGTGTDGGATPVGDGCEVCRGPKAGSHICDKCRDETEPDAGDSEEMVDD